VKKTHKSLNAVLLAILKRGVGVADEPVEYHDLDERAGSWVTDPDFDAAMEAFESVEEELWLFTRDTHFNHLPQLSVI